MARYPLDTVRDRWSGVVAVAFAVAVLGGAMVGPAAADESIDSTDSIESTAEIKSQGPVMAQANGTQRANDTTEVSRQRLRRLVHEFVNRERVERGLDPLALNETLSEIARYHSLDMARNDYFAHVSPDNETLLDRYDRFGFECRVPLDGNRYATGSENVAFTYYEERVDVGNRTVNYTTTEELARGIVQQLLDSPPHRKNILRPYWQREGLGFAFEETPNGTRVYVTQNFC